MSGSASFRRGDQVEGGWVLAHADQDAPNPPSRLTSGSDRSKISPLRPKTPAPGLLNAPKASHPCRVPMNSMSSPRKEEISECEWEFRRYQLSFPALLFRLLDRIVGH
jgi:hypothetical protein